MPLLLIKTVMSSGGRDNVGFLYGTLVAHCNKNEYKKIP